MGTNKTKATIEQLGLLFSQSAIEHAYSLAGELKEHGITEAHEERIKTIECQLELLIFIMFPLDLVINQGFGRYSQKIRRAFRDSVLDRFRQVGWSYPQLNVLENQMEERFDEYCNAFSGEDGLLRLASSAYKRIMDTTVADSLGAALCAAHFMAMLRAYGPLCEEYEIGNDGPECAV
ncbi:MAG TPA: hypothetical protein GXX51_02190 [Firmicutes bacterium]|nr:hypothetical protein [Bacillota bacterium]